MGLTERHWFENEEPELTERQLEDIVYENKRAYDSGYAKGYSARNNEIVRCGNCKHGYTLTDSAYVTCGRRFHDGQKHEAKWFCADGERREAE